MKDKSLMRIALWLFAVSLVMVIPAIAMADSAIETGGLGLWVITALFESGTITNPPEEMGIVGTVLMPLSFALSLVAGFLMMFKSIQYLVIVGQKKDPEQAPMSLTWAPIHMVLATVLLVPTPSGYTAGQHGGIWLAKQSNLIGNIISSRVVDFFDEQGVITPDVPFEAMDLVDGIVEQRLCTQAFNSVGDFNRDLGGTGINIEPEEFTNSSNNSYIRTPLDEYTNRGAAFRLESDSGNTFRSSLRDIEAPCGVVNVAFRSDWDMSHLPDESGAIGSGDAPNPITGLDGEPVEGSGTVTRMTGFDARDERERFRDLIQQFDEANQNTGDQVLTLATSPGSGADVIAQHLLFDLEKHFKALSSSDSDAGDDLNDYLMDHERDQVQQAVDTTIQLYRDTGTNIYGYYAKAASEAAKYDGLDWGASVRETGWMTLGLHWMQMTARSNEVRDAMDVSVDFHENTSSPDEVVRLTVNDSALANRLDQRLDLYYSKLKREIQRNPDLLDKSDFIDDDGSVAMDDTYMTPSEMRRAARGKIDTFSSADMNLDERNPATELANDYVHNGLTATLIHGMTTSEGNVVSSMVNTGHRIVEIGVALYLINKLFESFIDAGEVAAQQGLGQSFIEGATKTLIGGPAGAADTGASELGNFCASSMPCQFLIKIVMDFTGFYPVLFMMGAFMAFYIPAIIMIQWLTAVVTWMIYQVEAVVVIPLWGLLFISDMGQERLAPETARQGLVHFLSILVYPALLIIGLSIGLKVTDVLSQFLTDFLIAGMVNNTEGYWTGFITFIATTLIVIMTLYQIIVRIFSMMVELNDRAMSWVGQRMSYNENSAEQGARGAFMGVVHRGEQAGQRGGGGGPKPGANKPDPEKG